MLEFFAAVKGLGFNDSEGLFAVGDEVSGAVLSVAAVVNGSIGMPPEIFEISSPYATLEDSEPYSPKR